MTMSKTTDVADLTDARGVELRNIRKEFDEVVAVDGIDIAIDPGELLVLLGPSGCGKSTTLRMIAGLEMPTEGTVHIGDQEVTNDPPQNRDISMVFQNYALYPHKTVMGNLQFPMRKMDLPEDQYEERVMTIAELLEIEDLLDKKPGALSGGQQQRVALGRTIVSEPSVFLLDEPLSNLDQKLRVYARAEIRSLQQRLGTTTIHVTHDQEEAMSIADKIAIMRAGEIEQFGTPETVYQHPVSEFVAGFLGEPEMNFVDVNDDEEFARAILGDAPDTEVSTIGFRPHTMYQAHHVDRNDAQRYGEPIRFTVEVIEALGDVYEVQLRQGEHEVTGEFADLDQDIDRGKDLEAVVDLNSLYFFDADGQSITEVR